MIRKQILGLLICLAMITAMMPQFVLAETSENAEPSETPEMVSEEAPAETGVGETPEDEFTMTLPTVYLHINGGQAEVDKMNESEDHSYHCKGTMDIIVPEGFKYVDSDVVLSSVTGLGMDIRGRGNTSWNADKKPYKIKLDEKTKILGMGKNKHWALIANAFDPSLMRNRITYWLGKELGLEFTPSGYPVDVFMEDEYYGSYLLYETIRVDKNRVEIDELDESITGGEALTGGYFVQFLQDAGAASTFSTKKGTDLQNVEPSFDPDDDGYESEVQKNYIRGYIQEAEDALFEG
ncbi:MAG: CotH kinase family protein, partial [Mogibacterium sp.]|nr:CotH kinase family protein [Mogibacterium sp.]